jgi:hypothetical protein
MVHAYRAARVAVLVTAVALSGISLVTASARSHLHGSRPSSERAVAAANSHWEWCQDNGVSASPAVVWSRIESATENHKDLPSSFWTNTTYRDDIAKIICYESTYGYHAENGPQYGWFQMSQSLIVSEGVTWSQYWNGTLSEHPGWYQCTAGERYIHARYSTPAAAWLHEEDYGWY